VLVLTMLNDDETVFEAVRAGAHGYLLKILRLITDGMSNRQIAAAMFLAEGTVKNYVSRIMEKLHANTRTALAVISAKQRRSERCTE
jgi:DNA-binding NarL/FixJ family response regulator